MNKESYKTKKARELRDVANCLANQLKALGQNSHFRKDKVDDAAKSIERSSGQFWEFAFENLELPVTTTKHVRPVSQKLGQGKMRMYLTMRVKGRFPEDNNEVDLLKDMYFRIRLRGLGIDGANYWLGFHIDKHNASTQSTEPHPLYHLQVANEPDQNDVETNTIISEHFEYGNTMFLDTPRIVHYPVDFTLGIAFALSNFYPELFERLRGDQMFARYCRNAQNDILYPYFSSILNNWKPTASIGEKAFALKLFPSLI